MISKCISILGFFVYSLCSLTLNLLSVDIVIITEYILCTVLKKKNLEGKRSKKTNVSVDIIYLNE
jgi:hypothetical protein